MRQLELQRPVVEQVQRGHAEVVAQQPVAGRAAGGGAHRGQRRAGEHEQPAAGTQQPGGLRDPAARIACDQPVLGDQQVEPAVGQRRPLGVGLHQRERQAVLALQAPGDPQLPGGQVDPDRTGAEPGQPGRHVSGAAAELQHVKAGDVVGQQPQPGLGDAPVAPYRRRLGPPPAAVGELVAVGSDVRRETFPERPVRGQILLGGCHSGITRQNRHPGQPDRTVAGQPRLGSPGPRAPWPAASGRRSTS